MERKKELKNDQTQNDYLENLRMNIVFKENTILFASIALGLGIFALTGQPMFLIALIAFGLTTRIISTQDKRKFYDEYKRIVVSETFREIFSNIYYEHDKGIDIQKIIDCDILPEIESYESYDYLKASINDINFECADVTIYDKNIVNTKNRDKSISFKGQWYIFDLNENYMSDIKIIDKKYKYNKRIVEAFKKLNPNEEIKNFIYLETDNNKFNELFNLYTIVDFDAINFLKPEIINNIIQLNKKVYGELLICIHENQLHIGVNNFYNNFEPKTHKKIDIENDKQKVRKELEDIANFIIEFNLLDTNN